MMFWNHLRTTLTLIPYTWIMPKRLTKDRPGSRQNPGPGQNWPILWNPGPGQNREIYREFDRDLYRILKFQFVFLLKKF